MESTNVFTTGLPPMEFVAKLREWGWECAPNGAPEPAMSPAPTAEPEATEPVGDDTEALEPAE